MFFGNPLEEYLINMGLIAYTFLDAYRGWALKTFRDKTWSVLSNIWALVLIFIPEVHQKGGWTASPSAKSNWKNPSAAWG